MLDDARLERLLRDAAALNDAERAVVARPRWQTLAMAAVVAIVIGVSAVVVALRPWQSTPAGGGSLDPLAHTQKPVTPGAPAAADVGAVVMAIAERAGGELECVGWSRVSGAAAGESWTPETLRAMGTAVACGETAGKILVVGLSGPAKQLPASDTQASEVAKCLLRLPPCGGNTADPARCEVVGGGCLGSGVAIRVEVVPRW